MARTRRSDGHPAALSTALADLSTRIDTWRRERDLLAKELREIRAAADRLLGDLGAPAANRMRNGRAPKAANPTRRFSPEARARMADAARRRWAAFRAAQARRGG